MFIIKFAGRKLYRDGLGGAAPALRVNELEKTGALSAWVRSAAKAH
jgi:hypothetical protein